MCLSYIYICVCLLYIYIITLENVQGLLPLDVEGKKTNDEIGRYIR